MSTLALPSSLSQITAQQLELLSWVVLGGGGRTPSQLSPISLKQFCDEVPEAKLDALGQVNPSLVPQLVFKLYSDTRESVANSWNAGAVTAFHGTSFENLHSIAKHGLLNLSGTNMQRNGAIFGRGVYLSTDLGVAFAFIGEPVPGWANSEIGHRLRCLLVCAVNQGLAADGRSAGVTQHQPKMPRDHVLVVDRADALQLRYILVYVDEPPKPAQVAPEPAARGVSWKGFPLFALVIAAYAMWLLSMILADQRPWLRRALRRYFGITAM